MREIDPNLMRQMEATCREIGTLIARAVHEYHGLKKQGFALFLFSFEGPEMTYMSNASRADMLKAMKEFIDKNPPEKTWEEQHGN
jgi:hypothetical protein